ncbi:hypothetical protein [Streptomyces sp. NPDC051684]|uniref:hypothetical protein n=1 Tax=Streptomyces sp. NPDC051684 TaxID=3365670 RepID=UPI0037AE40FB
MVSVELDPVRGVFGQRGAQQGGPTAPAFAQAGYGIQYKVKPEILADPPGRPSVSWLVGHGYSRRVASGSAA